MGAREGSGLEKYEVNTGASLLYESQLSEGDKDKVPGCEVFGPTQLVEAVKQRCTCFECSTSRSTVRSTPGTMAKNSPLLRRCAQAAPPLLAAWHCHVCIFDLQSKLIAPVLEWYALRPPRGGVESGVLIEAP